jgi:uncharacterized protein YecA (UPF0149 family)
MVGIHRTTIHHWCHTRPEFIRAFDAARHNRQTFLDNEMDRLARHAITVLEKTLSDDSAPAWLKVNAALAVLRGVALASSRAPLLPNPAVETDQKEAAARAVDVLPKDLTPARNAPCPCGSRAKYKRCCGVNTSPALCLPSSG